MRQISIHNLKDTDITTDELYALRKASFEQWKDEGLYVYMASESVFATYLKDKVVFVAQDAATGELLAMHTLRLNRKRGCAAGANLAVAPSAKHEGIASRLLQEEVSRLRHRGYRYLVGSTGIPAVWSVRWHLKNGYRIVEYKRSERENYPSYVFRKQFATDVRHHPADLFWLPCLAPVTARLHYAASWFITRVCKTSQGRLTPLGRLAQRLRVAWSN